MGNLLFLYKQFLIDELLLILYSRYVVAHHLSVDDQVAIISDLHVDVGEKEQSFMKLDIQSVRVAFQVRILYRYLIGPTILGETEEYFAPKSLSYLLSELLQL